ncbi:FliM/FliN family flagellar motor switch protein [Occallatibacter savannae]|uniref:FliM/FliN family flagellar motor switch protein n=1 Tax=Occallatibacter savannae TaxID=1002691 RepID=UPI000D68A8C9|nr:FliM/FliN family flagellar motor C-terminal domain-containing protein [Occallatibacter savannae]
MGTEGQLGGLEQQIAKVNSSNARTELTASPATPAGVVPELPEAATEERSGVRRIPVEVDVSVPIERFRVRDVLALSQGQVIVTRWMEGEDMPLAAHGTQLAWSEIEVIEQRLAVRITRLA